MDLLLNKQTYVYAGGAPVTELLIGVLLQKD